MPPRKRATSPSGPTRVADSRRSETAASATTGSLALGNPERQLPAGRMPDEHDPLRVERVLRDELLDELDCGRDVVAGPGPRSARVAAATVLEVPGRDPRVTERDAQMTRVDQVVHRLPRTAVDDDRERKQPVDRRQP